MRRLLAFIKRRSSRPAVSVEISWNCAPGSNDEQLLEWLKKNIRTGGGGTRVLK